MERKDEKLLRDALEYIDQNPRGDSDEELCSAARELLETLDTRRRSRPVQEEDRPLGSRKRLLN
jgi:hypothetical protein